MGAIFVLNGYEIYIDRITESFMFVKFFSLFFLFRKRGEREAPAAAPSRIFAALLRVF